MRIPSIYEEGGGKGGGPRAGTGSNKRAKRAAAEAALLAEQRADVPLPGAPVGEANIDMKKLLAKRRGFLSTIVTPPGSMVDNSANQKSLLGA